MTAILRFQDDPLLHRYGSGMGGTGGMGGGGGRFRSDPTSTGDIHGSGPILMGQSGSGSAYDRLRGGPGPGGPARSRSASQYGGLTGGYSDTEVTGPSVGGDRYYRDPYMDPGMPPPGPPGTSPR